MALSTLIPQKDWRRATQRRFRSSGTRCSVISHMPVSCSVGGRWPRLDSQYCELLRHLHCSEVAVIRTVSMLPAATEVVGALGLMDQLFAVSHECDYPDEANHRPRVTRCEIYGKGWPSAEIDRWVSEKIRAGESLYTLDEGTLRELAPDLILTQRLCDVCAPAYSSVA